MLDKWFNYIEEHWTGIIFTQSFLLVTSALAGYWIQGIKTGHWDINSMWTGVGAVATAAAAAYGKWFVIGKYNTTPGQPGSMTNQGGDPPFSTKL